MFCGFFITIYIFFSWAIASNNYGVYFSSVYPNTFNDYDDEYIEVTNISDSPINLSWFSLKDKSWKTYIFWSSSIIVNSWILNIPYWETKIQLNNTDEELYFYDNLWELIDNYSYSTSTKWQIISRDLSQFTQSWSDPWETDSWTTDLGWLTDSIFTNTWILNISYTWASFSGISFSWAGILESYLWENISSLTQTWIIWSWSIEFSNLLENHTYFYQINLVNSWVINDSFSGSFTTNFILAEATNLYYDDNDKNGKIDNLEIEYSKSITWSIDLSKLKLYSNTGWLSSTKINDEAWFFNSYYLSWNILWLNLIEQDLLNTNLQIDNTTNSDLRLKSLTWYWVLDLSWNSAKNLSLTTSFSNYTNIFSKITSGSWGLDDEIDTNSWITQTGSLEIPDIVFEFQNPSYLVDKNLSLTSFVCDNTKDECKVNFDLTPSFTGIFLENNYYCTIDFSFTGSNLCNPNSIIFPVWETQVKFRIYEKWNTSNYKEKIISIINSKQVVSTIVPISSWWWNDDIFIPDPIITIQSWVDKNYICEKDDCILNLTAENSFSSSKISCLWNFWNISYNNWEQNKCNPGYLHYTAWTFEIKLKLFEAWNSSNYKETSIKIYNNSKIIWTKIVVKISLQWTIWSTKKQEWNSLWCYVDECSVNFTGEESYVLGTKDIKYFWDFWNWQNSSEINPKSIIYKKWNYKVSLKIQDNSWNSSYDYFNIFVIWKEEIKKEEIKYEIDKNISQIKLSRINPNPLGKDASEWIELENIWNTKVNVIWCKLDDIVWKWSKAYKIQNDLFIEPKAKLKLYSFQTNIILNNNWDEINLICWDYQDKISRNYSVLSWFIITKNSTLERIKTKVIRTVDWDTLVINLDWTEEKVRLIWVDTPETVDPRKSVQFFWKEASNYTKNRLTWKEIELEFDAQMYDKYDRILAYIRIDWIMYNRELIMKWYARAYLRYPFRYYSEFEKLGKEAQKNKVWMFADEEILKEIKEEIKEEKEILKEELEEENNKEIENIKQIVKSEESTNTWTLKKFLTQNIEKINENKIKIYGKTLPNIYLKINLQYSWSLSYSSEYLASIWDYDYNLIKSDLFWNYEKEVLLNLENDFNVFTSLSLDWTNFYNLWITKKVSLAKLKTQNKNLENSEEIKDFKAEIIYQWKYNKSSYFSWNIFYCNVRETCSINLKAFNNKNKNLKYIWEFSNWIKFEWLNPKTYKLWFWKYFIKLTVIDEKNNISKFSQTQISIWKIPTKTKKSKEKIEKPQKVNISNFLNQKNIPNFYVFDFKNLIFVFIITIFSLLWVYNILNKNDFFKDYDE